MSETVQIPLRSRKYVGFFATVDKEDYPLVSQYVWNVNKGRKTYYAITYFDGGTRGVFMHRMILNTPLDKDTDHWDGNGLNNVRSNLREATRTQNNANRTRLTMNTTGFRGVFRSGNRWRAQIQYDHAAHHLGCYGTREEAARAYDVAARQVHGEYAALNFPDDA